MDPFTTTATTEVDFSKVRRLQALRKGKCQANYSFTDVSLHFFLRATSSDWTKGSMAASAA